MVGLFDRVGGWRPLVCGGAGGAVGDDGCTTRATSIGRTKPSNRGSDADSLVFGGQIDRLYPAWRVIGAFWLVDFALAHDARLVTDLYWLVYVGDGATNVGCASYLSLFGDSAAERNPALYSSKL